MANLKDVQEQIEFMISLHQESLDEYLKEYENLTNFLDKKATDSLRSEQIQTSYETVKDVISSNFDRIQKESEDEVEFLKTQLEMIQKAVAMEPAEAKAEVEDLILQDIGEIEKTEAFKERMKRGREVSKQEFFQTLDEIKQFIEEGSIEELATFCQASKMLEDQKDLDEQDDFEDEDDFLSDSNQEHLEDKFFKLADNQKIKEILENYNKPYFVEGLEKNNTPGEDKN